MVKEQLSLEEIEQITEPYLSPSQGFPHVYVLAVPPLNFFVMQGTEPQDWIKSPLFVSVVYAN